MSDRTRARWAASITRRAEAQWTRERTRRRFGDKELILPPTQAAPLLRALGLLGADASMSAASTRKYMQVNHMVKVLESAFVALARDGSVVRVLDAGCGSSHLALALAWCFAHRWGRRAQIMGVDRNASLVEACRRRAETALLHDTVRFEAASIGELDVRSAWRDAFGDELHDDHLHAVVALHACDTATDDALALALSHDADLIAAAPCCQAELARRWAAIAEAGVAGPLEPVWSAPHLRREAAATMTDALRVLLLRGCGYSVTPMEFVASSHTPKNTLLRAVRVEASSPANFRRYVDLRDALGGADIRLASILPAPHLRALDEAVISRT